MHDKQALHQPEKECVYNCFTAKTPINTLGLDRQPSPTTRKSCDRERVERIFFILLFFSHADGYYI